jgi:hypothetical protein
LNLFWLEIHRVVSFLTGKGIMAVFEDIELWGWGHNPSSRKA